MFCLVGMLKLPKAAVLASPSKKFRVALPENLAAVACYKRAGFEPDGFENHRTADGTRIRLLRMAVQR